jgi:hypothetical protein
MALLSVGFGALGPLPKRRFIVVFLVRWEGRGSR